MTPGAKCILATLLLASTHASAEPIVVLESRVGSPPPEADALTTQLQDVFEDEGLAASPETIEHALGARLPHPGQADPTLTANTILLPLQQGYLEWTKGRFEDAKTLLRSGLLTVRENPALLATDTKNLDTLYRAMAALMLSEWKLAEKSGEVHAQTVARDSAFELARVFPDRPLPREEYAPDAIEYYKRVLKDYAARGRGKLTIDVNDDGVLVFVDAQMRGVGKAALVDASAGTYRVFLQEPSRSDQGRRYDIPIKPDETLHLAVNWQVDSALSISETWAGIVYESETEHRRQAAYAAEIASWVPNGSVIVIDRPDNARVMGTLYGAGGRVIRRATVNLDADRTVALHHLARYLADGSGAETVVVEQVHAEPRPPPAPRASGSGRSIAPGVITSIAGAAIITGGAVAYETAATPSVTASTYKDPRSRPVQVVTAGCGVLGLGLGLWLHEQAGASLVSSELLGLGVGAIAAGALLYATSEHDHAATPTYRNTTTLGIAVGVGGLIAAGVGVFAWRHALADHGQPIATLGRDAALVGWSGAF